jgi:hypothetical protein
MHECSIDKDPSGPAFKGACSLIAVDFGEQGDETLLQDVFCIFPIPHVPQTDGHHFGRQDVEELLLGFPVPFLAGLRQTFRGRRPGRGLIVPCPSNKMQFVAKTFQWVRILFGRGYKIMCKLRENKIFPVFLYL